MMSTAKLTLTSKGQSVANNKAVDISALSFAELTALVQEAQGAINSKRTEEIKVLTDAFAKKLVAAGFSIQDGLTELQMYLPKSEQPKERAARGSAAKKVRTDVDSTGAGPVAGATYVLDGVSWTKNASGLGATKKEFKAAVTSGQKTWAELLVK